MTRKWTPFGGRALAAVFLALALAGCATEYMSSFPSGMKSPLGSGLSNDGKAGSLEGQPSQTIDQPPFKALYQTPLGPMAMKANRLYTLTAAGPQEWGNAPRVSRSAAIWLLSDDDGWSVGEEGISRYQGGVWVPVTSGIEAAMAPTVTGLEAVQLTDVAFAGASIGYAVGTHGTVLRCVNGTWSKVSDAKLGKKHFGTVRVASGTDVWVAGEGLLHYDGAAWESIALPSGATAVSGLVVFDDALWTSTGDRLWRWDRATKQWSTPAQNPVEGYVGAPQRVPGTPSEILAWALDVGTPEGALYRLSSATGWERATVVMPPEVGLDSLVLLDSDTGYALSFDGSALYRLDQGTWSQVSF